MLVEAEDAEDAIGIVRGAITHAETPYPAWSDWHGGIADGLAGRWSGLFQGWEENQDVLCYTENKVLADDIIKEFLSYRIAETKNLWEGVKKESEFDLEKIISEYDPYKQKFDNNAMNTWRLQRIAKILNNDWCSDTGVYDLHDHTANLEYFKDRLDKKPEKQYLVPVDFHF
jgi:hypothetical protein